jgi:hypothetical protein
VSTVTPWSLIKVDWIGKVFWTNRAFQYNGVTWPGISVPV